MREKYIFLIMGLIVSLFIKAQTPLDTAVNFSAKDITGATHRLFDDLDSGKVVLLDFFTTACSSCREYAPEISQTYLDFGCNTGNVIVLGINYGSNNHGVHVFDSLYHAIYPSISGTQGNGNQIHADFQVVSYPTVIVITPDRLITNKYIWPPSHTMLDSILISHNGIFNPCTVGISDQLSETKHTIKVFPNPATDHIQIEINTSAKGNYLLQISGITGKVLTGKTQLIDPGHSTILLNVANLSSGFYLLTVKKNGNWIETTKFLKTN